MTKRLGCTVVWTLIALAVLSRWLPHPPNFSPIIGIALFAAARFPSRWLAFGVPLVAMAISDLILGWHSTLPFVYLGLGLSTVLGWQSLKPARFSWGGLAAVSTASAFGFFIVSNFGVWLTQDIYVKNWLGLGACFIAAIPFFPATLLSSWLYSFTLFGLWAMLETWSEPQKV